MVAQQHRDVHRPQLLRIDDDLDRHRDVGAQRVEQRADFDGIAAADVVDLAARASMHQEAIGAHRVSHVREIAARREVADPHRTRLESSLDARQLTRKCRGEEPEILSRADVVEGADDHDVETLVSSRVDRDHLLGQLAHAVRRGRPDP